MTVVKDTVEQLALDSDLGGEHCLYPRASTDVSEWEKLTLANNGDLERALRRLEKRFTSFKLNLNDFDTHVGLDLGTAENQLAEAIAFYSRPELVNRPELFFRPPSVVPNICLALPQQLSLGEVLDLRFRSHFEPCFVPFKNEFLSYKDNRDVFARMWRHPDGTELGTVIAIHGWFMGDQRVNALALVPGFFFRMGLNVVLYELPYHGRRAPNGQELSGSVFPSAHLARTNEGIAQAIYELRSLRLWFQEHGDRPIGVVGVSLGGYVAALWATLDKLEFAVPMVPLVSMADLAWDVLSRGDAGAFEICPYLRNITLEQLRAGYAPHALFSHPPKTARECQMIVAGLADSVIPTSQPTALWEHWGRPEIFWFEGGHIGQISQSAAFAKLHRFFCELGLARDKLLQITV